MSLMCFHFAFSLFSESGLNFLFTVHSCILHFFMCKQANILETTVFNVCAEQISMQH